MKSLRLVLAALLTTGTVVAADSQVLQRGHEEEQHSCVQCHSLRLVESQRLSRNSWAKEIDKMIGWGAPVRDRQLLLDYLSQQYSDAKPVPQPELTGSGVPQKSNH